MMKRFLCSFVVLGALFFAGCDNFALESVRDDVHRSFGVEPGGTLTLDSDRGSVEVSSGGTDQLRVDVERTVRGNTNDDIRRVLDDLSLDFRQEGKDVHITARLSDGTFGFGKGNRLQLRYIVLVPDKYNLDLRTGGGSITVNDLEGTVQARTAGGSLQFGRIKGSVNGRTSGGSIRLDGGSGPVDVKTSGGSIQIGKVEGPVIAHTSGGGIKVEEVRGRIEASTSGGSVEATITNQPEGDCELRTSGGSIRARLSKNLNLNLEARTSGGSIHTNVPVVVVGNMSRNRLEAKMNQGGPGLRLLTSGGSITISGL